MQRVCRPRDDTRRSNRFACHLPYPGPRNQVRKESERTDFARPRGGSATGWRGPPPPARVAAFPQFLAREWKESDGYGKSFRQQPRDAIARRLVRRSEHDQMSRSLPGTHVPFSNDPKTTNLLDVRALGQEPGGVLLELPYRSLGGQLPPWDDLLGSVNTDAPPATNRNVRKAMHALRK